MADTSNIFCRILFDVLEQKGVRNIVCSPGSRNVPLLMAAEARKSIKKFFAIDERTAAFMALGICMVKQEPVGLVCTSGTALLNYAPAIAEAYYQKLPLIVISADRPSQWIDQDDSQTLRQEGVLSNFVNASYSIPAFGLQENEMQWYVNRITNDAVLSACGKAAGPVHINIHLAEPLNATSSLPLPHQRTILSLEGDTLANKEVIRELVKRLKKAKVLVVAGFSLPDSFLQKEINRFARFTNVTVMAETISNLHLKENDNSIDSVLTAYEADYLDKFTPDIVISFGGALVSRKLKEYLRRNSSNISHWAIGYTHSLSDPFMNLELKIETPPERFFKSISSALYKLKVDEEVSDYQKKWEELRHKALKLKNSFIESCDWSELKAFDYILKNITRDYNLFISNGTPIRYAQIIQYALPHASYCNRGVSGIDGCFSTAIGGALAYKGKTLMITGDLSLAYDIGGFCIKETPENFKLIVIDNQGGGIFRFIPTTSSLSLREEYLCMPPLLPLVQLAEGYGWNYFEADSLGALKHNFKEFLENPHKSLLKIICNGHESAEILKNYMALKV